MNLVDLALILVVLFSIYSGYQKGFIRGAIDLLLLALSLVFAFWAYRYVAAFFEKYITVTGVWTLPLAFIISYFFARIILSLLANLFLRSIPHDAEHNVVNNALGILPGAVNGIVSAAILGSLILAVPLFDGVSAKARESAIVTALTPSMEWAEQKFAPIFDKAVNHSINKLTVVPGTHKSITLPYSVKDPKVREDLETKMLDLVNEERQKVGLPPLKADPEMREIARAHSRDMFARSYFSHNSPEGKTLTERAAEAGIRYLTAGENLALAQTLSIAHTGLMNSPGHKANILHESFGRVGIGILDGGRYGIMVTQDFRN
jgi:uncharacterized protein YkwD